MPTNAEIHAAIDLYITAQRSHILNNTVAQVFHDMVDNISAGPGGTPGIDDVLAEGQALTANRIVETAGFNFIIRHTEDIEQLRLETFGASFLAKDELSTSQIVMTANDAIGTSIVIRSDKSPDDEAAITLDGATSIIEYEALTQKIKGDVIIFDSAGGGTTGLSIDNDGKIIRTP